MSDLHALPLRGHDLPEISREVWLRAQTRARVYKTGPWWVWEHVCWGRGGVPANSYPMASWALAFAMAQGHVERCIG